ELSLDDTRVNTFSVGAKRASQQAQYYTDGEVDSHLKARIPVAAGPHDIGAAFIKKSSALLETELQPYQAHFNYYRHPRTQPAVYSVSVTGPFDATGVGETPSRRRIFVCRPTRPSDEERCATAIIANLARRAYRRPVTNEDLRIPLGFYKDARAEGNFETGIEMALRTILTNAEFIFRVERDPENIGANRAYRISDLELASRLSFFLWSSIPDDELL